MSPAKPADPQILSSTRERIDCISSLAIHADLDDQLQPLRPVSLHKSERDADSKVRGWLRWHLGVLVFRILGWECISSVGLGVQGGPRIW